MNNNDFTLRVLLPQPPKVVWSVLTDLHHMQQWFFAEIEQFEPRLGFATAFAFRYHDKTFTHQWDVRACTQEKELCLGWQYAEYPGEATAVFRLAPQGQGTRLDFSSSIITPFPAMEEFSRASMEQGWTDLLQQRLKQYCAQG